MSTQTLSSVTLETLENYRTAAEQAVTAYRLGGHRLVAVVNDALENRVYPRTAKLAPRTTDRMNEVRGSVSEVVVKGIDQVADRTEKAIEFGSTAAAARLRKVSGFAAGLENELVVNGLQVAARLTMPGAKLALVVSGEVAKRASALAEATGAHPARRAVRKARKAAAGAKRKATPVARKARATVKTVSRRVAKVARTMPAKAKPQRVVRAAKKIVAAAAAA